MADPRPPVSSAGEYAYGLLAPLGQADPANAWLLLRIVAGLAAGEAPVWELGEDPGAGEALQPATASTTWLPFLAQVVGGRLRGGMSVAQQRVEVVSPSGWMRGRPQHLIDVASSHLTDTNSVVVRLRYDGSGTDAPGHLQVRVRASAVKSGHAEALARDLVDAIPAHLLGSVAITDDNDWQVIKDTPPGTWRGVLTNNTDWADVRSAD